MSNKPTQARVTWGLKNWFSWKKLTDELNVPAWLHVTIGGWCGFTSGSVEPLHTNSQKIHHFITLPFLPIHPPLLPPPSLQSLFHSFTHILSHLSSSLQLQSLLPLSNMQMWLLQTGWYYLFRWSDRVYVCQSAGSDLCSWLDLLVSVAPDLLYFLQGSLGIHLCLSLAEFVFGICRFLQSWNKQTNILVLCGVFCTNRLYNVLYHTFV